MWQVNKKSSRLLDAIIISYYTISYHGNFDLQTQNISTSCVAMHCTFPAKVRQSTRSIDDKSIDKWIDQLKTREKSEIQDSGGTTLIIEYIIMQAVFQGICETKFNYEKELYTRL